MLTISVTYPAAVSGQFSPFSPSCDTGLELSTIFCSHRLRFGAVINLLLTLVAAAYMVVVAYYWLFVAGGKDEDNAVTCVTCTVVQKKREVVYARPHTHASSLPPHSGF